MKMSTPLEVTRPKTPLGRVYARARLLTGSSHQNPNKIIVILGPTASGKSDLAIKIAEYLRSRTSTKCEVISADSRQVYRGLNIGTGKVPISYEQSEFTKSSIPHGKSRCGIPVYRGIRHHLLDVISPKRVFTAAQFQTLGRRAIKDILRRGKLPIICGGTGHYIDALIYNYLIPEVKPNRMLRAQLERESTESLFKQLKKLDPNRAANIDRYNRRRLIRALEIVLVTKKPVPSLDIHSHTSLYEAILIGIKLPDKVLRARIAKRLRARIKQGMIKEVRNLHKNGLSWTRMESLGLEYRYVSRYLRGLLAKKEMVEQLEREIYRYAKRQMTWFKRNPNIQWIAKPKEAMLLAKNFLKT